MRFINGKCSAFQRLPKQAHRGRLCKILDARPLLECGQDRFREGLIYRGINDDDLLIRRGGTAAAQESEQHGEGYLRLPYANPVENIERAIERMAEVLG